MAKPGDDRLVLEARRGDTRFGICSTAFLEEAFRTDYYRIDIAFHGDDRPKGDEPRSDKDSRK